jgi:hypothetical protein
VTMLGKASGSDSASHTPGVAQGNLPVMHDNFLPEEDFVALQQWGFGVDCQDGRVKRKWSEAIVRDYAECLASRQWESNDENMPPLLQKYVAALKKADLIAQDAIVYTGIYRWMPRSGIGMHTDSHAAAAIILYLNDTWDTAWNGDFVYHVNDEQLRRGFGFAVLPKRNRLLVNHSAREHKVTYTSGDAPERVTVQAFVKKDANTAKMKPKASYPVFPAEG